MAGNSVDIYLRGHNQASPVIQQVFRDLGGLDSAAATLAGGLRSVLGVVGVAGIAALGVQALRTAADFGDLGERVQRSEKYFVAFSGSAAAAAENLTAMQRATEGALSTQEAYNAAAKLMSMGLANNSAELEQVSRMAVMLGGNTRTASEAIEEFSLLLANQSILRLDTFGISGARVRERIEELQAATADLSREQAFMQAVMEEGTKKVEQLEAAGVKAGTAQDRLRAVTADLKAELAGLVEQPYTIVIDYVVRGLRATTFALSDEGSQEREYGQTFAAYQKAAQTTAQAQEYLDQAIQSGSEGRIAFANEMLRMAQVDEAVALAAYRAAQGIQDVNLNGAQISPWADAGAGALANLAGGLAAVGAAAQSALGPLAQVATDAWYGSSGDFYRAMTDDKIREDTRYAREVRAQRDQRLADEKRAYESAAKSAAAAYNAEFEKVSGRIQGYLSQGMNVSVGLLDMRQDQFAAGANGPFENLYRALDVAKQGGASPWAAVLGLDQESAKKISADFQRGIFSPEVMGLIDTDALVQQAKLEALAEKTQKEFAAQIAKKAGVGTNLVSSMFGFDTKAASGQDTKAKESVDAAMSQVAGAVGDTVKGKDFAGKIIGYGETIWGYFEKGIVDTAKNSSSLQAAIDGMVAKALAARTGGSATNAARSGGTQ